MVAPAGVDEGSTEEPADPEPAEPSEPLRSTAAEAAPAGIDPAGAGAATAEVMAAGPIGTEPAAEGGAAPTTAAEAEATEWAAGATEATRGATGEPEATRWVAEQPAAMQWTAAEPEAQWEEPAERRRRGRGLGVAVFVLVIVVLVGGAAGGLAVVTHGFHRKTEVTYRQAAVFKLRPGECVNFGPNGQSVTVLSCATPHDAEVFATFPLPASSWPGGGAVQQDASSGCASRLGGYLNPQLANAGLEQEFFYPDQEAWKAGTRTVVCEVRAPTGQLTGSVRDLS